MIEYGDHEEIGQKEKVKTAGERTRRPWKKTAKVETLKTQTKTSQGNYPRTFEKHSQGTQAPLEETAIRLKGGEFEERERKRSGRRRQRKRGRR